MSDYKGNLGTHLAQQKIFVDDDDRIKRPQDLNLFGCQALARAVAKMAAEMATMAEGKRLYCQNMFT